MSNAFEAYAQRAARDYLASMDYYGNVYVSASSPSGPSTPSYCENKLRKAFHMRKATALPTGTWRGDQWSKFALHILADHN